MALASRLSLNHGQRGILETRGIVLITSLLLLLLPSQTDAGCPFQNPFWFLDRQVWQRESRLDLLRLQAHCGDCGGQPGQDGPWQSSGEFAKVLSSPLIHMALLPCTIMICIPWQLNSKFPCLSFSNIFVAYGNKCYKKNMALGKLGTTRELQVRRLLPDWVLREGRQGRKRNSAMNFIFTRLIPIFRLMQSRY